MKRKNSVNHVTRRGFLQTTLATMAAPYFIPASGFGKEDQPAPSGRLAIACIGMGGQMNTDLQEAVGCGCQVVALCDVDKNQIAGARGGLGAKVAGAKEYHDYRELFADGKSFDAVIVATPDHWHAPICLAAMKAGKHVYCEKPLAHTVSEAREVRELSRRCKVVTQTGNQGAASGNFRRSMELIQAGLLGAVREIHVWHPPHEMATGVNRPDGEDPIPEGFDWDFWVGTSPMRPYKTGIYHPKRWRWWYDFGNGALGDFCCHGFSMPARALKLEYPTRIEVSGTGLGKETFAKTCRVRFLFPPGAGHGAVAINFYSGGDLPPAEATAGMGDTFGRVPDTGCLVMGEKGVISAGLWNNECFVRMQAEKEFQPAANHGAARIVPITLPRAPKDGHMLEWLEACRGNGKTFSPFEIGGHITEIGLVGAVALRLGRDIDWDGEQMKVKGVPEASALVKPDFRRKWLS